MIKLFLIIVFLIHILGLRDIVKSGDKNIIFFQSIILIWCGSLLLYPSLNPKIFIFLVTLIYSFTFSVMLFNKTENNIIKAGTIIQGILALLGITALLS